jgi:nucleotide-binding universal stress UspA family protein
MQKNILLPTDFSHNAWNAIIYALKLYAHKPCKFYLLNSIKMKASAMSNLSNRLSETINNAAMRDLLELKQMVERVNANANHSFEIIVSTDELKEAIESAIKRHQIHIVVMGTKGASGAKEVFFGSNTVRIISKMRLCPVLTVPDKYSFVSPKQIAFPTDFNRFYEMKELNYLKDLADLYNSRINIIHINNEDHLNDIQEYNSKMLEKYLKNGKYRFFWIPSYTKKTEDINAFIKEHKIDMLAMVNYQHSFIEKITKEPIIKTLGFHPIVPFLVIPE